MGVASLGLVACTANHVVVVHPEPGSLAQYLEQSNARNLYVTGVDGGRRLLHDPRLDGDLLVGNEDWGGRRVEARLTLGDIATLAEPRFSGRRTALLVGGFLATVGIAVLALVIANPEPVY